MEELLKFVQKINLIAHEMSSAKEYLGLNMNITNYLANQTKLYIYTETT